VAIVVAAGAAAYLWFYQRDLVDSWLAADAPNEAVDIGESAGSPGGEGDDQGDAEAVAASRSELAEVVATAADRARETGVEQFETAHAEADSALVEAVGEAADRADKTAEREKTDSTVDLLAAAQQRLENGDADAARETFHEIIDREPQNSEAITGLGWSLLNMGNTEAAIAQFEKALHHNPSYGDAHIGLGQAHQAAGNSKQALEAYQTYLDRFPGGSKSSIAEYQSNKIKKSLGIE